MFGKPTPAAWFRKKIEDKRESTGRQRVSGRSGTRIGALPGLPFLGPVGAGGMGGPRCVYGCVGLCFVR